LLDHEIFRLRDEVEAAEGPDVTFYGTYTVTHSFPYTPPAQLAGGIRRRRLTLHLDFLEIESSANQAEIKKAYHKKSRLIHPDKVKRAFIANRSKPPKPSKGSKKQPGVSVGKPPTQKEIQNAAKEALERFKRLGIVTNILKGPGRERYDHFIKNGFPKWRGTGYYYSRFRPGLGTVLAGLFVAFGGAAHYVALVLGWKRQREFVDRYIRHARRTAWGDELGIRGIPGVDSPGATVPSPAVENGDAAVLTRRQRRTMDKGNKKESKKGRVAHSSSTATPTENVGPTGERRRVHLENGKVLIVDSIGNVFLEEENEDGEKQEFLLDVEEIQRPTIRETMLCRLPVWLFRRTVGRLTGSSQEAPAGDDASEEVEEDESQEIADEKSESSAVRSRGGSKRKSKRAGQRS
jgi:curved DNA-binding protein CbpA